MQRLARRVGFVAAALCTMGWGQGVGEPRIRLANTYVDDGNSAPRTTMEIVGGELDRPPYNSVLKLKAFESPARNRRRRDCTAVLTEHRQIAVTAAHCLVQDGMLRTNVVLYASYQDRTYGAVLEAGIFWIGVADWREDPGKDIAVLYIEKSPPDGIAPLPIARAESGSRSLSLIAMGFSEHTASGERLVSDPACYIHAEHDGSWPGRDMMYHDCNLSEGASGAPLLSRAPDGRLELVGIHVGELRGPGFRSQIGVPYSLGTTNFAVKAGVFRGAVDVLAAKIRAREPIDRITKLP